MLRAALVVGLAALAASPLAAAGSSQRAGKAPGKGAATLGSKANLLSNGGFDYSLDGWTGYRARLSRLAGVVRVTGRAESFSLLPTAKPVSSTVRGARYFASASVRSATPGLYVCLRIREWAGHDVAGSAQRCLGAGHSWSSFASFSYRVEARGHALDAYIYARDTQGGSFFDVNYIRLSRSRGSTPQPAATGRGVKAMAVDSSHICLDWRAVPGATIYRVLRGGLLVGMTRRATFTDALLWPATRYTYRVVALGARGARLRTFQASAATALLPRNGFPRPFPAESVWNTPVGGTPVHTRSPALAAYLTAHATRPSVALHAFGVSVAESHPSDLTYSVQCVLFPTCTLGAFGRFAIPATARPDPAEDSHLAVIDPDAQREWDLWRGSKRGRTWTAGAGAAVSMKGDGVAPRRTESANAANFPLLGGILRPEEIAQGHVDHALVFMMPGVSRLGHVCPATHNDGDSSDPNALMEGMRIQLDPSLNVGSLPIPAWQKTIARGLQVYGAFLRDSGGSLAIVAENPISRGYDAWAKVGLVGNPKLNGIPWDRFRVLEPPSRDHC